MIRRNNPFNIRYSAKNNWQGQVGENNGFAVFTSLDMGIRAACKLILNYPRPLTIESIITRWAPPTENDTERYIMFVGCGVPCLKRTDPIENVNDLAAIMVRMGAMESGVFLQKTQIYSWLYTFNKQYHINEK